VQKSGLKEVTKRLDKANSDVTKRSKALTRDLERSRIAGQQISGVAEKLDKALSDLQVPATWRAPCFNSPGTPHLADPKFALHTVGTAFSKTLVAIQRRFHDFQSECMWEQKREAWRQSAFESMGRA
jgi:hypothetical protein